MARISLRHLKRSVPAAWSHPGGEAVGEEQKQAAGLGNDVGRGSMGRESGREWVERRLIHRHRTRSEDVAT